MIIAVMSTPLTKFSEPQIILIKFIKHGDISKLVLICHDLFTLLPLTLLYPLDIFSPDIMQFKH